MSSSISVDPAIRTEAPSATLTTSIDPVTRVGGALAAQTVTDGEQVVDARIAGRAVRGFETILLNHDPRDALAYSSRACGWSGGVNQTTSSLALEMAWGLRPPPMALVLRQVAQATEAIWDSAAHLAVRAGPDWSAAVVKATTPWLWDKALKTGCGGVAVHGFKTIAELMEALTPVEGSYWWETIPAGRRVLEMINLLYGKYPHPSTLSPGGAGSTLTIGNFTEYFTRLYRSVDYVKKVIAIWDDLIDFLYEADPRFAEQGVRPASFVHAGAWDDADRAQGTFEALDADAAARLAPAGVMIDGHVVTTSAAAVHAGLEEYVGHSFYDRWDGTATDPLGQSLGPAHPWSKTTLPHASSATPNGAYSWSTAPRWQGNVVESTPLGRLWLTALRQDFPPNDFIEPTGTGVRILVPGNFLPETVVEWRIPRRANMLERLRADAYGVAFDGLCAAIGLLKGFELSRRGEVELSSGFTVLDGPRGGVGMWESGRGLNAHWVSTDNRRITKYQILTAHTINASPRDDAGQPGPIEEALIGTPLIAEGAYAPNLDVLRVVRSFDPCMWCATH